MKYAEGNIGKSQAQKFGFYPEGNGELLKNIQQGILCFKNAKWGKNLGTGGLKDCLRGCFFIQVRHRDGLKLGSEDRETQKRRTERYLHFPTGRKM